MIRVPLDPLDLSLLASTGDIPYISFWTLSRNTLEPYLGAITKSFLIPLGMFIFADFCFVHEYYRMHISARQS